MCSCGCGKYGLIVQKSLGLIASCNQKRLVKKYQERRKQKVKEGKKAQVPERYYKMVWAMNDPVCFETGVPLYHYHKWHVHHLLHKEDYPELALKTDISVLLSLEMHMQWHQLAKSDREKKMPKTWAKYVEICKKYNIEP